MKGKVLSYSDLEGQGLISGDDGRRYAFVRGAFQGEARSVAVGSDVDFLPNEDQAEAIYILSQPPAVPLPGQYGDKNRIAAGLLALFLGWLGVHKFYLGRSGPGLIMLLCGTVGWLLFAIPPVVVGVIGLVECIIYLTMTDEQFHRTYVQGDKAWF